MMLVLHTSPRPASAGSALFVPFLLLVACNSATGAETEPGSETGMSGATSASGASGGKSQGGSSGSSAGGSGGTVTTEGGTSAGGTEPEGGTAGSAGGSGGAGGQAEPLNPDIVFDAHFTGAELGPYARDEVTPDFGVEAPWDNGLEEGRATIEEEDGNKFLRVTYVSGIYGPSEGGVQFVVDLGGSFEELYFAYRVRFQEGFAFNMGGKLPGFGGGTMPTGCQPDEGGFSARNMWRTGGAIVQYVYWPDQPNTCGDDLYYEVDGDDALFTPGTWQTIEHYIRMNTPGSNDGVLETWVDGESAWSESDRQWRKTDAFAIDSVYFSTFFGGGSQPWASPKEQWADFDDLKVSKVPISH